MLSKTLTGDWKQLRILSVNAVRGKTICKVFKHWLKACYQFMPLGWLLFLFFISTTRPRCSAQGSPEPNSPRGHETFALIMLISFYTKWTHRWIVVQQLFSRHLITTAVQYSCLIDISCLNTATNASTPKTCSYAPKAFLKIYFLQTCKLIEENGSPKNSSMIRKGANCKTSGWYGDILNGIKDDQSTSMLCSPHNGFLLCKSLG